MAQEIHVRGIARVPFGAGSASTTTVNGTAVTTLDLDNGQTRRTLQNERARFVVLPDLYPVMTVAGGIGTATVGATSGYVWRAPRAGKLTGVVAQVGTAVGGTVPLIVDVINAGQTDPTSAGTSVYTGKTGQRPTIGTSAFASTLNGTAGVPVNQNFAAGDFLRVQIAQGTAGNMSVQFIGY